MLFLRSEEIARLADRSELITAAEAAFRIQASGDYQMPVRTQAEYKGKTWLSMPCFTGSCFGAKLVSIVPGNPQKKLPPLFGIVVLNDGDTGEPLAILDGAKITALRTAAVGALSIKYLAAPAVSRLGVIGAGVQGYNQILFACSVRPFTDVHLYDHNEEALHVLGDKLTAELPGVTIKCGESALAVLRQSEVVITATNTEQPLFPNDRTLFQNRHFVGIGSYKPEMREYPEALFRNLNHLFLDTEHALQETGDVITPLEKGWIAEKQIVPFHLVISGTIVDVANETNVTFFKSVGMALLDIVVADFICNKAREKGCGVEIHL
jgi:ornithine cyclodeaminase/alanine dehydrogenase-like protein (mu-crystallin family)